jgi:RNA polymerase sigma factor (sigma-70 family)
MYLIVPDPSASGGEQLDRLASARLEEVWQQHFRELLRRSLRWTNGRHEDAEDALAQAAVIALQKLPRDLDSTKTLAWFSRLAYSRCMDIYRERRRAGRLLDALDPSTMDLPANAPNLESLLLSNELSIFVRGCIRQLPPGLRSVAEYHLVAELKYAEVADRLGISEVNARKRMQQAREVLRDQLRAYLAGRATLPLSERDSQRAVEPETRQISASSWSTARLRSYVRKHPRGWKKQWELARRLREEKQLEEAVDHFRSAAGKQPRQIVLRLELGEVLVLLGRTEEAIEFLETALRWVPDGELRGEIERRIECLRS